MLLKWLAASFMVMALAIVIWASDKITYEGERTVYTVRCEQGSWEDTRCTGRLVAGDRYRFRASKSRQEVLYWVVGSSAPSGKYTNCTVKDRGNWSCREAIGQPPTITHGMLNGHPARGDDGTKLPVHAVPKWQWWLLDAGVPMMGAYLKID